MKASDLAAMLAAEQGRLLDLPDVLGVVPSLPAGSLLHRTGSCGAASRGPPSTTAQQLSCGGGGLPTHHQQAPHLGAYGVPGTLAAFAALPQSFHKPPRTSIPYREPRRVELCGLTCALRTPKTRALCQLLALATVVLVLVQALSCGLFFCVALPIGRTSYIDLREVFTEFRLFNAPTQPRLATAGSLDSGAPMLIPR